MEIHYGTAIQWDGHSVGWSVGGPWGKTLFCFWGGGVSWVSSHTFFFPWLDPWSETRKRRSDTCKNERVGTKHSSKSATEVTHSRGTGTLNQGASYNVNFLNTEREYKWIRLIIELDICWQIWSFTSAFNFLILLTSSDNFLMLSKWFKLAWKSMENAFWLAL